MSPEEHRFKVQQGEVLPLDEPKIETGLIPETRQDRMVRLAKELLIIGVSQPQVVKLLGHDLDLVEQQIEWLPYRKARKPASMIVSAIERGFEMPSALWEEEDE